MTLPELSAKIAGTIAGKVKTLLNGKVDKIAGKGLSTEDYSAEEKATLAAVKALLQNAVLDRTASGNPATFDDGAAANVRDLKVTLTPTQSGSGDPSPTNVRPISGVSSVTVTRSGENGANSQSVTVALTDGSNPLTVYGGTLDVTTGELTVTHKLLTLDGVNLKFDYKSSNTSVDQYFLNLNDGYAFGGITGYVSGADAAEHHLLCSHYPYGYQNVFATQNCFTAYISSNRTTLQPRINFVQSEGIPTVETANQWLDAQYKNGTPVEFLYPLAEPFTYQLTPAQLATLSGYNAVSSDAGAVDVTYKADTSMIPGGG